jgi:hypothetical protein
MSNPRYWINTVSREHVMAGVAGGFTQADHGRNTRLKRLAVGDRIAFYSPRTAYPDGAPLQQFTALGTVTGDDVYQVRMREDFHPWRRTVAFDATLHAADVRPLVERLSFIADPRRWGYPFRRGLFEVPEADFAVVEAAMRASPASRCPGDARRQPGC